MSLTRFQTRGTRASNAQRTRPSPDTNSQGSTPSPAPVDISSGGPAANIEYAAH